MRWLFIAVLVILVACVLSIVWMNDTGDWPQGDSRFGGTPPAEQNPLTSPPPAGP